MLSIHNKALEGKGYKTKQDKQKANKTRWEEFDL